MSWWDVGKEKLTIGDVPADKITAGLKKIATTHGKPTLPQLLSTLGYVLKRKLIAHTSPGTVAADGSHDPGLERELGKIVDAIIKPYSDELKREPRTEEILACFTFVLGFEPERYLSNLDGSTIEGIVAEPNGSADMGSPA
jgi:hypothetical protein